MLLLVMLGFVFTFLEVFMIGAVVLQYANFYHVSVHSLLLSHIFL